MNAPIIIFSYNRPKHLNNLLNSLVKNNISKFSKNFFFVMVPKNQKDERKISEIKSLLKFKIKIYKQIFRKKNIGLANNIINGVSQVLKKYRNCIVLEDDLVINKNCINYMNCMLKQFKNNKKIGSVSAHSYIDNFPYTKNLSFIFLKDIQAGAGVHGREFGIKWNGMTRI